MQQNESASVVCNKAVGCESKLHKSPGVFQLLCLCLQMTIDQDQGVQRKNMFFSPETWAPDFCFLSHLAQYKQKFPIPKQMFTC